MILALKCPKCEEKMNVSEEDVGKRISCPGCDKKLTVPDPANSLKKTATFSKTKTVVMNGPVTAPKTKAAKVAAVPKPAQQKTTAPVNSIDVQKTPVLLSWVRLSQFTVAMVLIVIVGGIAWPEIQRVQHQRHVRLQREELVQGLQNASNQITKQLFPDGGPLSRGSNEAQVPAVMNQPFVEATPTELTEAYKNEIAGTEKFGGKRIQIVGLVSGDVFGSVFLRELGSKDRDVPTIPISFPWGSREDRELSNLRSVKVILEGICANKEGGSLCLHHCRLVSPWGDIDKQVAKQKADEEAAITVAAEAVEEEIKNSVIHARAHDDGKAGFIEVQGKIEKIRLSDKGDVEVVMISDNYRLPLACRFRKVYRSQLAALTVGQELMVRGEVISDAFSLSKVQIHHCVLMR